MKPLTPYSDIIKQGGATNKEKFDAELVKFDKTPKPPEKSVNKNTPDISVDDLIDYIKAAKAYSSGKP